LNDSSHPLFGRLAQALGARVLDQSTSVQRQAVPTTNASTLFAIRKSGLDAQSERELRGLGAEMHASGADHWHIRLPAIAFERRDEPAANFLMDHLVATRRAFIAPSEEPVIMAILNVTPDSFSDGGQHADPEVAIEAGLRFLESGATWLDIGGESTRPGADEVSPELECERVLPVIEGLAERGAKHLSVDTRHALVARRALECGATMVNDVGAGLDDPDMLQVVAEHPCEYVLMHRQGTPKAMQEAPQYGDVLDEVIGFLRTRAAACLEAGIDASRLWVDPGIGFGKRLEHNLDLLRRLSEMRSLGLPLLLGPSRKSFIAHVTGAQKEADWARLEARDNPLERIGGTSAAITFCVAGGAKVLRVHDVSVMSEATAVASAIQARPLPADTFPGTLPPTSTC
jgi:dihydropteroate synthase